MKFALACERASLLVTAAGAPHGWLSAAEQQRLAALADPQRRAQFIAARWLGRTLVARELGGAPADWPLTATTGEPPAVLDPRAAGWQLAISHSGDWVACALADAPVGLDLEAPRRRRDIEGLAALCLTPAEQALLAPLDAPARESLFYALWTVKEAWIKRARGAVAPGRLQQLEVARAGPETAQARTWTNDKWTLALCLPPGVEPQWHSPAPTGAQHWCVTDAALSAA